MSDYDYNQRDRSGTGIIVGFTAVCALTIVGGIAGCMAWYPEYGVYQQRMAGEAELAQSTYSKQVQVQDAQGKLDSAKLLAQVEVERAKGVAAANKIIGDSLKDNEAYLKYLWITDTSAAKPSLIYVPTEANIPILEAGRKP